MGRQIEFYMELDSFKLLVRKAFELGFKVIEDTKNNSICSCYEDLTFTENQIFFYLEEAGQLKMSTNGFIDAISSPVIDAMTSYVNEKKKEISTARLWVSTGFWINDSEFINRNDTLDKKFSSLVRYVKKLAPLKEVGVKAINPMFDGKKFIRKVYITPYLMDKIKSGEYDCI